MTYERRLYRGETNRISQDGIDLRFRVREVQGPHWWHEVARWPEERRERWAERAAIMEVDGGLVRGEAERQAFARLTDP